LEKIKVGIIGGSGLYEVEGAKVLEDIIIDTPWGSPSDIITIAEIDSVKAAFLPRHGKGHLFLPSEIPYRANIAAMKIIGVEEIYAFSAVGSLKEEIKPTHFVLPDQVIDRTKFRESENSFFEKGIAGHIAFADPFCFRLHDIIKPAMKEAGITYHSKETLICMEGPAFSTRAESRLYRTWGAGLINMTTLPEAKLAREAQICYAVICMSTDYDSWKDDEEHVSVEMIIKYMSENSANGKKLIHSLLKRAGQNRDCTCPQVSKYAIFTSKDRIPREKASKIKTILPGHDI
jgi:5'-methylthioadenosine phosphorylase